MPSKNNFDNVAWCYDSLSFLVFGKALKQSQLILLDTLGHCERVLIIGGGTGWILPELLKRKKVQEIDYVESSFKMLQKARQQKLPAQVTVNFIHADAQRIVAPKTYDAVLAFYFFDLFPNEKQERFISIFNNVLKAGGKLLVADFYLSGESPYWQKKLMKLMYCFFSITSSLEVARLEDFRTGLKKNFKCVSSVAGFRGMILSEVYQKI